MKTNLNETKEAISICSVRIVDQSEASRFDEVETLGKALQKTNASMLKPSRQRKTPRTRLESFVMMILLICSAELFL